MQSIIVTGGAGFIGSHLVDRLVGEGNDVTVIDNLSTGKKGNLNPKAKFIEMDIRSSRLGEVFLQEHPDRIFHLAAVPRVPISVKDPVGTSDVNITGTINVFTAAKDAGAKRVVFASSSSVYGNQKKFPLKEDMAPNPLSPYGLQKLVGEQFAKLFSTLYTLPVISLRFFNVYGPRIDFDSDYSLVLGKFLKQQSQAKPLTIYGDGEQTRAFCYVDDVVEAIVKAGVRENLTGGEIMNVGALQSHSVNQLAKLVGGEVVYMDARLGDVRHTQADLKKARELLDWEPHTILKAGITRVREWFDGK